MRNLFKVLGIIAVVAIMVSAVSCATGSSIGGTSDMHGLMSKAKVVADNGTEIAKYSVILNLFDSGYEEYAAAVMAAEAAGKRITTVTTFMFFKFDIVAYAK